MVAKQHYRWDFVGLSTDTKPTPETSEKVVNGSTYYCSDTSKLYVFCDGTWYERKSLGGGGGGSDINVVQTTGQSTTDVMSQKAVTDALAGAGGVITELTSADYNYPTESPTSVALWTLPTGLYYRDDGVVANVGSTRALASGQNFIQVMKSSGSNTVKIDIMGSSANANDGVYQLLQSFMVSSSSGVISDFGGAITTPNIKQTTGDSTTDVMSQKAVTDTIFAENDTGRIKIGTNSTARTSSVSIGEGAGQYSAGNTTFNVALGAYSGRSLQSGVAYAVALGSYATPTRKGEVNIGTGTQNYGYNNTPYRVLGGVHDPVDAHDAATKGYVDANTGYNFNSQVVQSALEDPEVPKSLTVAEYQALEDVCVNLGKLYYATSGQDYYARDDNIYFECFEGDNVTIYSNSQLLDGFFTFAYSGGVPTVTYTPNQV